jgi:hypothetical protein
MSEDFQLGELEEFTAAHPGATVSEFMAYLKSRSPAVFAQAGLASAQGSGASETEPDNEEDED